MTINLGGDDIHAVVQRHRGVMELLNVIIYLYCNSSKPYFVCNDTGKDQYLSHSFLFLTKQHHVWMIITYY